MPMHKDFPDWYGVAAISPSADLLQSRWDGVETALNDLTSPNLIALLNLFCIHQTAAYKVPHFLDDAFRKHDVSFPSGGRNLEELRVLAGSILRLAIETQHNTAVAAALGLVCGSYTRKSQIPFFDHVIAAETFLATRSVRLREIKSPPSLGSITKERLDEVLPPQHFAANQTSNLREPLLKLLQEMSSTISSAQRTISNSINVHGEELNILWWLQNKFSRELKTTFAELSIAAPVILGTEAADLTNQLPGPIGMTGVLLTALDSMQQGRSELSILDSVNASPKEWRTQRTSSASINQAGPICPVLLAFVKSLDTDGALEWLPVYRKICDIPLDEKTRPIAIASQIYAEHLFIRAISGLKG